MTCCDADFGEKLPVKTGMKNSRKVKMKVVFFKEGIRVVMLSPSKMDTDTWIQILDDLFAFYVAVLRLERYRSNYSPSSYE